ncbi:MAG: FAD binding domain-containing protein [Frankiaceae bacterium]
MKPAPFEYVAARDVPEAVRALAGEAGARALAGGQALVPLVNQRLLRPPLLVDIGRIYGLDRVEASDGSLRVGATARLRALESHPLVVAHAPVLAEAAALVGPVHVRNRATLGGSLVHADPAAEVPAALLAAGARVRIAGPGGERWCGVEELIVGAHRTALGVAELVVAVELPLPIGHVGGAFRELAVRTGDLPLVGVGCQLRIGEDGRCSGLAAVACGVADRPRPLAAPAARLLGAASVDAAALREVAAGVGAELEPVGDARASAAYRRELAQVLTVEALAAAWRAATGS